jgi:hypothetical protein
VAVVLAAALLVAIELASPCPAGGPLAFGSCRSLRPFAIGVVVTATAVYVAGLSAVLFWVSGLRRRRLADGRAARDWYLLAATIGLPVAVLLAFTVVSALR